MSYLNESFNIKGPSAIIDGEPCIMITDERVRNPPYQLRAFNFFNQSIQYLHKWAETPTMFMGDKTILTTDTVAAIYHNSVNMIQSLESTIDLCLNDNRTTEEKLCDQAEPDTLAKKLLNNDDMFSDKNFNAVLEEIQPYYDDMSLLHEKLNKYNLYRR